MNIGLDGKFRPETYVKDGLDPKGFKEPVYVKVSALKTRGNGGRHNGNDILSLFKIGHKDVKIVNADAGAVRTGGDAFPAAYAQIRVMIDNVPRTVIAHLGGAHHDTAVAINAFVFDNFDNRTQRTSFRHFVPPSGASA
jgi:hypothetical protein